MAKYIGKSLKSMLKLARQKYPPAIEFKDLLSRDKDFAAAIVRQGYRSDFYAAGILNGKKVISPKYDSFEDEMLALYVTLSHIGKTTTQISLEDQTLAKALWERNKLGSSILDQLIDGEVIIQGDKSREGPRKKQPYRHLNTNKPNRYTGLPEYSKHLPSHVLSSTKLV